MSPTRSPLFDRNIQEYNSRLENAKAAFEKFRRENTPQDDPTLKRSKAFYNELKFRVQMLKNLNIAADEARSASCESKYQAIYICTLFLKTQMKESRLSVNNKSFLDSIREVDKQGNSFLHALVDEYEKIGDVSSVSEEDVDSLMLTIGKYLLFHREQFQAIERKKKKN